MSYKVGDNPKFIHSIHSKYMTLGKRYKIISFDSEYSDLVDVINDQGKMDMWNIGRFQDYKEYQFDKEMNEIINE